MKRELTVFVLYVVLALGATATDAGVLSGGSAAVDITPRRLPVSMTGSFQDRQAESVHDRLHARCLVLDDGTSRIAVVVCDSCLITRDIYDRAKAAASKQIGIPADRILTAATHTHTAPTAVSLAQCHADPEYVRQLTQQITESIVTANANLRRVQIGWGVVAVPEELNNRRWFVQPEALQPNPFGRRDDKVRTNPPRGTDVLIRPAGPIDPDVTFLALRTVEGEPVSLLANYGLHYVGGIPANQLSADYFGEFARQIAKRLNAPEFFVAMMSNGASGDVNNISFQQPRPNAAPFVRVTEVASVVAGKVGEALQSTSFSAEARIAMQERELTLGVRQPDAAELTRARDLLKSAANPQRLNLDELYAQESVRLSEGDSTATITLQTMTIGELAIVGIPCEVFAEIGLEIKKRSPYRTTVIIGLANGYNGYLPSPRQHALGGYETWRSGWSYLDVDASTKITAAALEMLSSLRAKAGANGSTP